MTGIKHWLLAAVAVLAVGCGVLKLYAAVERDWTIQSGGLGDITLGAPLPLFVLGMRPEFYNGYHLNTMPFIGCRLPSHDISIRLEYFILVQGIVPGPDYRTAQNTGQGSTLAELRAAHGTIKTNDIPEPYHCVARSPELPDVHFEFTSCEAAELGEGVVRVNIW